MVAWDRNPASSEEKYKQGLADLAYGKAFSLVNGSFLLQPHWEMVGKPPEASFLKALSGVTILPAVWCCVGELGLTNGFGGTQTFRTGQSVSITFRSG